MLRPGPTIDTPLAKNQRRDDHYVTTTSLRRLCPTHSRRIFHLVHDVVGIQTICAGYSVILMTGKERNPVVPMTSPARARGRHFDGLIESTARKD